MFLICCWEKNDFLATEGNQQLNMLNFYVPCLWDYFKSNKFILKVVSLFHSFMPPTVHKHIFKDGYRSINV